MARKNIIRCLNILVGLPGSGKTTFAKDYVERCCYNAKYVDCDALWNKKKETIDDLVKDGYLSYFVNYCSSPYEVVLDGLFVKEEEYKALITSYMKLATIQKVCFHYWIPDIEACLWNDKGRREVNSESTIKGLTVEKPDKEKLSKMFDIPMSIAEHGVIRKPAYKIITDNHDWRLVDNKYLRSQEWSLGGISWSYTGDKYPVDAESPRDFVELDDFLMDCAPNLTFLQYKKLQRECVKLEEEPNSDYYSETRIAYWLCDMEKLSEMLKDFGYTAVE